MKSFEEWMEAQAPVKSEFVLDTYEDFGNGMWTNNGQIHAVCCVCDGAFSIDYLSVEEAREWEWSQFYCGGSPRCCP